MDCGGGGGGGEGGGWEGGDGYGGFGEWGLSEGDDGLGYQGSSSSNGNAPSTQPTTPVTSEGTGTSFTQRQMQMLADDTGYNVSPESTFQNYPTIGREGTFVTDRAAIADILGEDFKPGQFNGGFKQAGQLETALGLEPGSLSDGFRITEVKGISGMAPTSPLPLAANRFFLGPGRGLPGGGPEIQIRPPISTR